jgi:hypothetical protein
MKPSKSLASILALLCVATFCPAEDWTTNDGKTYNIVSVIKRESASVTVLVKDGNYTTFKDLPLSDLPQDLQKRFHYDATIAASLKAGQEAQAEMSRAETEQSQKETNLYLQAKTAFDQSDKIIVGGHIVPSTDDNSLQKPREVDIYLFSKDQAQASLLWLAAKANTTTGTLQGKLNDEHAHCLELKNAIEAYHGDPESDEFALFSQAYSEALKQYKGSLKQYYHCYSSAYYSEGLPKPLTASATDASGNFVIQVPKNGSWVLGAHERSAGPKETEGALWLLEVNQDSITQKKVELNARNSSASGSSDSLIKTMDQPTIDQIVSTANYLLKKAN